MKANAPEKIWINQSDLPKLSGYINKNSIEYTRTDAFIEEAAEWLSEIENGTTITDIDNFVEDFKNYMKGE